jgi:hypothetical protein
MHVRFGTLEKNNLKTETSAHSRQADASARGEALLQHVEASELHPRLRWAPSSRSGGLSISGRLKKERSFDIGIAVQVAWIFVQANNRRGFSPSTSESVTPTYCFLSIQAIEFNS